MLNKLTQAFGVSGREAEIDRVIMDCVREYADEVTTDGIDNIIVYKKGSGKNKKKIMISAHKDEIGFMVMSIDKDGYLKVRNVGGINVAVSVSNKIMFRNGTIGIVGYAPGLGEVKGDVLDMYVDIGATSKEDAEKKVMPGDVACYMGELTKLQNGRLASKAMDDRIGCYIAIQALMKTEDPYNDMYYVFSSQEELGLKGATVASRSVRPDIGIAVDITGSFDTPDSKNGNMKLGGGAAIKVMDRSVICDETVVGAMVDICKEKGIKYQMDILASGGTDAGAMNTSNFGVRAGGVSIPTRNGHSPVGMVDMADVGACIELLAGFAQAGINV
ncbi:MAG: M42 family peptidase [Clostridia bacterium]|nr:M42 family peptidase [Clostridia bacterium]